MHRWRAVLVTTAWLAGCSAASPPLSPSLTAAQVATGGATKEAQAEKAGIDAVVYGLPLVMMDLTMRTMTNVRVPAGPAAPVNQLANVRSFPDPSLKDVVRPNVDTLYSSAWLDLSAEPMVLSVPNTHGRYYLMPMLDAWTKVIASPGKRTTGTEEGHFAITGPGWKGTLPGNVTEIKSPTNLVWVIGRTETHGPKDYPAVHAIQDGYSLVPLSAFGRSYTAPLGKLDGSVDMRTPPVDQLRRMSSEAFFERLASLLKSNPPPPSDAPMLARLASIGVVPGARFELTKLEPAVARQLSRSLELALAKLDAALEAPAALVNGWRLPPPVLGDYGDRYGVRAAVALDGLGANRPEDAVYPFVRVDTDGRPLDAANKYVLHFDKDALPPVHAFWSVTMYGPDAFLVQNSLGRHALSSWMPLQRNADGSLDLYVQRESPGEAKETNWLPAGEGSFDLVMRLYWPRVEPPSVLDGTWKPPGVKRVP